MNRPDSPPPRQPSPDFLPLPLPYPRHPRRIRSQPRIKVLAPPGILQPARSYDFLRTAHNSSDHGHPLGPDPPQSLALLTPSTSASSSRAPSVKFAPTHRRTRSVAFPSPSPSPAPSERVNVDANTLAVPIATRYTGPRHIICPQPISGIPIVLPEIDQPYSDARFPPAPPSTPPPPEVNQHVSPPALDRHKSMGIACLKFFAIRSPLRRPHTRVTTTM